MKSILIAGATFGFSAPAVDRKQCEAVKPS